MNNTTLRRWGTNIGLTVLALGVIYGLWNLVIVIGSLPSYDLPTPQASISYVFDNWSSLQPLALQTIKETVIGFFIGALIGFVLAILMASSRVVQRLVFPVLITSQAVPIVAVAAPVVLIFGFGLLPKLIIVTWIVFFPVAVNVLDGLAHIDPDLLNLSQVLGASRTREFTHIRLPATYSPLFSGLKIGATYAVSGAVIGEWTASATPGLGTVILSANSSLNAPAVFGATMLLTVIGVVSFLLVRWAEGLATPWRTRSTARRGFRFASATPAQIGGSSGPGAAAQPADEAADSSERAAAWWR